jgi:hypothetical protein
VGAGVQTGHTLAFLIGLTERNKMTEVLLRWPLMKGGLPPGILGIKVNNGKTPVLSAKKYRGLRHGLGCALGNWLLPPRQKLERKSHANTG